MYLVGAHLVGVAFYRLAPRGYTSYTRVSHNHASLISLTGVDVVGKVCDFDFRKMEFCPQVHLRRAVISK